MMTGGKDKMAAHDDNANEDNEVIETLREAMFDEIFEGEPMVNGQKQISLKELGKMKSKELIQMMTVEEAMTMGANKHCNLNQLLEIPICVHCYQAFPVFVDVQLRLFCECYFGERVGGICRHKLHLENTFLGPAGFDPWTYHSNALDCIFLLLFH